MASGSTRWYSQGAEAVMHRRYGLMPEAGYRMMTLRCTLVVGLPIGTNRGLRHLLWMLVRGRLLASRGAVVPGLSACGLPEQAVRRASAALGQGGWTSGPLRARWAAAARQRNRDGPGDAARRERPHRACTTSRPRPTMPAITIPTRAGVP